MIAREAETTATVAVRVPRDAGDDLASCASRRLERAPGIEGVDVLGLVGLDPSLAATVATVEVAVRTADWSGSAVSEDPEALEECLGAAPGVERVEALSR